MTKDAEGFRSRAYKCPAGTVTIGYGHTRGVHMGMTCTRAQAEEWLEDDLTRARNGVAQALKGIRITEGQALALMDFAFNLGVMRFRSSTLCKMILAEDFEGAAGQFKRWVYAGSEKLPGLVARRDWEEKLFREEM